jgi:alpha-N-acetylglucosamine transferase
MSESGFENPYDVLQSMPALAPVIKQCAYVTLVMKGDSYVPGAIALAQSIRTAGTRHQLVCMITEDVKSADSLATVYDSVVKIPYLEYKTKSMKLTRQNEIYGHWLSVSYTKWNVMNLTTYEKVLFIDADTIVTQSMDHLFDLTAPAATFSSPWAKQFKSSKYRLKELTNNISEEFDIDYPRKHGSIIAPEVILKQFSGGYTFIASLTLLKPSATDFSEYKKMLSELEPFGFDNYGTPDEQSLAWFYTSHIPKNWTHIHQIYNFIIHKPDWIKTSSGKSLVPVMLHYFNNLKPWHYTVEWTKTPWNTDHIWWYFMHLWAAQNPDHVERIGLKIPDDSIKKLIAKPPKGSDAFIMKPYGYLEKKYFPWLPTLVGRNLVHLSPSKFV